MIYPNYVKQSPVLGLTSGAAGGAGLSYFTHTASSIGSSDGSVSFDGIDDCLTVADNDDFEFGSGNFTLEAFIKYNGNPGTGNSTYAIFSKWDNQNSNKGFILRISDDGGGDNLQFFHTTDGSSNNITTGSTVLSPGTWYHIAFVRNGSTGTFYIDGVADSTTHSMGSDSIRNTTVPFRIGANLDGSAVSQEFNGLISNVRVSKLTALYTSNFTTPTSPLTAATNTKLLCCKSKTSVTDAVVTPGTITNNNGATVSSSSPSFSSSGGGAGLYVDDLFSTSLYTASGSTQTINNGIDLAGEGGMVWIKNRSGGSSFTNHTIVDSERIGSNGYKSLYTNLRDGQYTPSSSSMAVVTSFNGNGFTRGGNTNVSNGDNVSWTFRKAPKFFDVVVYNGSGPGTAGNEQQISHNLGSKPGMIWVKRIDTGNNDWYVFTDIFDGTYDYTFLNTTNNFSGSSNNVFTASHFNVGGQINDSGATYVAYLFGNDEQVFGANGNESIIKCGSYVGTGNPHKVIDVGFEPQCVIFKNASTSGSGSNWYIMDTMRRLTSHNSHDEYIFPNTNDGGNTASFMYPTPTGFGFTATGIGANQVNDTYIYVAIRRPHKPPTSATEVFDIASASSYPVGSIIPCNFTPDYFFARNAGNGSTIYAESRLSDKWLKTSNSSQENSTNYFEWDSPGGKVNLPTTSYNGNPIFYQFRRAPGVFDVCDYRGNGTYARPDLKVNMTPELVITKRKDSSSSWGVHLASGGSAYRMYFDNSAASGGSYDVPSAGTSGRIGMSASANGTWNVSGGEYTSLCFASVDGISKIGYFTGTGNNVNVDCGFSSGARFIMIKRIGGGTSNWYVWDKTSGIGSGNDPWFSIDSGAEYTNTDYIDPLNSGFTVTSNAGSTVLNYPGSTYMFLAIA